jgi:hypothetical protein
MSCLDATFTLTPRSPYYSDTLNNSASLYCRGADFWAGSPADFSSLYASNRFFFDPTFASDPKLDYTQWANRKQARFLSCSINLQGYAAAQKQLALIFGFDVWLPAFPGRVLVYSDAGLLRDQQLVYGDNQFLLEIESLDLPFQLYFIHAGGLWFFRGLSGYVV